MKNNIQPPVQPVRNSKESGQAIVLVALFMITLLAATGMAIDGGGLYFLYRDARNAADAAAIAAVYTLCIQGDESGWQEAAIFSAQQSGFINDAEDNDHDDDGNITIVEVGHPAAGEFPGKDSNNLVEVRITAEKTAYFIQVLGLLFPMEDLDVSARTVAECNPGGQALEQEGSQREKIGLHIRSPRGTCGANKYSFAFAGTNNSIYGDIYIGDTIMGGGCTTPGCTPIYGNLQVAAPATVPPNVHISHLREETTVPELYDYFDYSNVDGQIEWNASPPDGYDPFPWNSWDDLLPGGSVQAQLGSNYHILPCGGGGKVENSPGAGTYHDRGWANFITGNVLQDGFYVPDYEGTEGPFRCTVNQQLQIPGGIQGNATIISTGKIETSGNNTQLVAYWEDVVLASNAPRTDTSNCKDGDHAIRLSGNTETLQGDILVYSNGMIHANGNNSTYESCFSAWAINMTGNNSVYACQPGGTPSEESFPSIGIVE